MAMTSREEEAQQLQSVSKGIPRAALKATFHLRRYMPLYVFATIWAVMIALVPTVNHQNNGGTSNVASSAGDTGATDQGAGPAAAGPTGDAAAAGSTVAATGGATQSASSGAKGASAAPGSPASKPIQAVQAGAGVTKTGVQCKPGVRQIPYSVYASPCVAAYTGGNGGSNGVNGISDTTIKIAIRVPSDSSGPNAQAVDRVQQQAGQLTSAQQMAAFKALLPWFNKQYELYGRHVEFQDFNGQGNSTDEAQSKGQEAACADANALSTSAHVFGVIRYGTYGYESQPFAECAKQYGLYLPLGAPYFPEQYYQRWDPYVWGGTMDCEKIAHGVAEYVGKRLAGQPAKYAGDATLKSMTRKFGTYVPDNAGYGRCVDITTSEAVSKWGASPDSVSSRYNYALDVSQFPSEAQKGIVQFSQRDHDTTVILACDPISITFLTQSASQQQYHPEWFIIGVALEDTDGYGRLYQADEVTGHLFGMSQLGSDSKVNDPNGEAARAYKEATGTNMPAGTGVIYYNMVLLFNQLQAAGPQLTIGNIAKATHAMAPGGSDTAPLGVLNYGNWHTAISDSREVYWDAKKPGYDGKAGTYVETYGGKRYQNGTWPKESPPIYPGQ